MRNFIEQLTTWEPGGKSTQDLVMALWFAETRCRELLDDFTSQTFHMPNSYLSPRDQEKQMVIDLDHYATNNMGLL